METWAIRASRIYTPRNEIADGVVIISNGRIAQIGQIGPWGELELPSSVTVIDVRPHFVAAGFIDLHVHGAAGRDFMDCDDDAFDAICRWHAERGTTALLATTCAAPLVQIHEALDRVREWQGRANHGARVLGAHTEGPFFNLQMRGCHLPEYVKNPTDADVTGLLEYRDAVRHLTIAPEIDGALAAIERFAGAGLSVSVAHSDATSHDIEAAIDRGAHHVTHLFNAMSYFHRRGCRRVSGVVETALVCDDLTVELIADGLHVNTHRMTLAVKAKSVSRVCLVTDAMRGAGMPDGLYAFGPRNGKAALVRDGVAVMPEGTGFASTTVGMNRCVQVIVEQAGVPLRDALVMASANPARVIGVAHRKGALEEGMDADLIVLDEKLQVQLTVVEGRVVYRAEAAQIV